MPVSQVLEEMSKYGSSTGEPTKKFSVACSGLQWSWDMISIHPQSNLTWNDLVITPGSYVEEVVD